MTTLRIAEVAERTGVPATTLRYYEDIGLVIPAARSGNGYRAYSERDVERLRFITRAKQLDISLDELRELLTAWDGGDCAGVQERMAHVVSARLVQTQERIGDLIALAAQLQAASARLAGPLQSGPCDDGCACSTAASGDGAAPATGPTLVPLRPIGDVREGPPTSGTVPGGGPVPAIACSLNGAEVGGRIADWRAVLDRVSGRSPVPGGVRLQFDRDAELVVELARLAVVEQACCRFFGFALAVTEAGVEFEVRAPDDAQDVVVAMFGVPGPSTDRS